MDFKDIYNAGGDILETVTDAINRGDYSGLSANVMDTVDRVLEQAKWENKMRTYGNPTHQYGHTTYSRAGQRAFRKEERRYASVYDSDKDNPYRSIYDKGQAVVQSAYRTIKGRQLPDTVDHNPSGRILGPIQLGWGIFLTTGFGITTLVMLILLLLNKVAVFAVLSVVFGAVTALGVSDIIRGSSKIGLVKRFYRYAKLIGDRGYIAIEELAAQTGRTKDAVVRDLKKMMRKHMFLQGRLDSTETTFMLTQEVYEQYQAVQQEQREQEAREREQEKLDRELAADEQTRRILSEGNDYIRMVRECNDKIQSEEMSGKLDRLERIMRRIFDQVRKHPESAEELHKFMTYYLPTTKKLLYAYIDISSQEVTGENMERTKREIEGTLDTVNLAFERLLDGLFEDTAWDLSSDMNVMKTMMAQEGLTGGNDFK